MRVRKGDLVELDTSSLEKLTQETAKILSEFHESFFVVIKGPYETYQPQVKIDGKVYQSRVTLAVDLLLSDRIVKAIPIDCLKKIEKKI